jgi:hypothetical protein
MLDLFTTSLVSRVHYKRPLLETDGFVLSQRYEPIDISLSYVLLLFSRQSDSFSTHRQPSDVRMTSGFRREVVEDCALLGH